LIVTADGVKSNSVSVELSGAQPESTSQIVISQIFGGGGNSGAPFRNDFIEIFNRGSVAVSLAGWSVQYASATASTWSVTPLTSVVLLPGQYYLVQQSSGGANGNALPAADASGTIAMAAGSGKVALVTNSTALNGACPNNPSIVDMVGYGSTANCFRGTAPAPAASNTSALLRAANGCQDLRNNVTDFGAGPPSPRNTNALTRICQN
jgi:predicted extracellular nuclease